MARARKRRRRQRNLAAGITELDASAQSHDDAIEATATFRVGTRRVADATLTIDADAEARAPGRISSPTRRSR